MPRGRTTGKTVKSTTISNITHVLLQTNGGLIVGTREQVESVGKENLVTGMTTTLINGRKRTRGTIVCLGTSAECEQLRKTISSSSNENKTRSIVASKSTDDIPIKSQTTIKKAQKQTKEKTVSTNSMHRSQVMLEQPQSSTTNTSVSNIKTRRTNSGVEQTGTVDVVLVDDENVVAEKSHFVEKAKPKDTRTNKRKQIEEQEKAIVKRKPDGRPSSEINREKVTLSSTSHLSRPIGYDTDEDEMGGLVIDECTDQLIVQQSRTDQRKTSEKEDKDVEKRYLNKCSTETDREALTVKASLNKPMKKRKEMRTSIASLTRQVEFLKEQLEINQKQTIALPNGDSAQFIIHLADRIRSRNTSIGSINAEVATEIGEQLADISDLLDLSEDELEGVRHPTDITKTVRQLTKLIYPDMNNRQKMRISTMDQKILQAIINYGRISHPFAPKNIDLRGHIGNVFASDRKTAALRNEDVQVSVDDENNQISDEESDDDDEEVNE